MTNEGTYVVEHSQASWQVLSEGSVTSPQGFKANGFHCGIKRKRPDLGWIHSEVPAHAAAVYTMNQFQAAPLRVTQESLATEQKIQSVIVNSGVANACTGDEGLTNAYDMRQAFADHIGIPSHYAAVVSTGLIGEQLPMDQISAGIEQIKLDDDVSDNFERAIFTTDTRQKHVAVQTIIDGQQVTIGGAAKGSGMIHPNMATMLGFVTTDAKIEHKELSEALKTITNDTFNMITVDGDTSTNDMVLVMANGLAGNETLSVTHQDWKRFVEALTYVCQTLAQMIARDGEGATKLIEVKVDGAAHQEAAQAFSKAVVGSSLVKTAIYGTDPNWGRIVTAIGYGGYPLNPNQVHVALGPITVIEKGLPVPFDEQEATAYLQQENIQISVNLADGKGSAVAWGCDLTYDYVKINASYRT
ncbi:bifunctional ornithine acetyltransferase/N-acetylglutamate synthase [Tuberibacillus sp. Marseille-P3662]|uniref:bifunctional ornithine acetyltransferase/N-acetylglutamate synthase n=1 Tax=Tuberibacillus sp. Marseille-P3662 TaxID=1965358 RepID=UPI000A1CD05E|nr:bifunctional ornithine acetyltransferase/N-acetylglutamate synthase [Tuberibacillus sp. Marseille-P3662]